MKPTSDLAMRLFFAMALSISLNAQVPSRPEPFGAGYIKDLDSVLARLSKQYFSGCWDEMQKEIDDLHLQIAPDEPVLDPNKEFYFIIFLARDVDGSSRLIRFAWHKPVPAPYAMRIPGKKTVYEVVLGAGVDLELATTYVSTETEDPIMAEVPKVIGKIQPAVVEIIIRRADKRGEKKREERKEVTASFKVRRVSLPFSRAKIKISDAATLAKPGCKCMENAAASAGDPVKANTDWENIPLQRASFGLISSYMLGKAFAAERARLTDDGYYAADPPKNPLTAVILNIHPEAYDPASAKMTQAERLRLFAGVVMTPDPGLCAGASAAIIRGLSVNVGMAWMALRIASHPRSLVVGGRPKTEPSDPKDPFNTSWRAVGFLGLGYVF